MSEITLVIQYENKPGSKQIAHLAVMAPGSIVGHAYPTHKNHASVAHYLCTRYAPEYDAWDELTVEAIQKHIGPFCPKCFGSPFDGISTS